MRRRIIWLQEQVGFLLGNLACLVLLVLFLPLVPVLRLYDDVRRMHDEG